MHSPQSTVHSPQSTLPYLTYGVPYEYKPSPTVVTSHLRYLLPTTILLRSINIGHISPTQLVPPTFLGTFRRCGLKNMPCLQGHASFAKADTLFTDRCVAAALCLMLVFCSVEGVASVESRTAFSLVSFPPALSPPGTSRILNGREAEILWFVQ